MKVQLRELKDTEKYLKLIEDRNKEIKKDKEQGMSPEERESNIYADRQTEIKINQKYFEKMGISLDDNMKDDIEPQVDISVDLDADYFQWKEEQEDDDSDGIKTKVDRISSVLKSIASGKK